MDDLQILVKAIVDDGSKSSMDSELTSIVEKLESKHKIELKVGLEDSSVQVVQTQLQAIAKQVSSANKGGSTLQVFDTAKLQADGRKYFASTKTLVSDVQKEFKSLGKVDVTNVFKNAKGDIQSFTASVTKADGTIEKFNFNLAQIKDGTKTLKGFVQVSSSLTDKNMGSGLNKTLDYLNKIEDRIKTIKSKTLTDTSKPLTADMQEYSKFNAELERVTKRIAEIRSQNTAMTSDQKREIDSLVNGLQRYGRELQKTAYAANDLAAKTFSNQKAQLQAALETDIKKWNLSGVFTGDFKKSVEEAKRTLDGAFDQAGLDSYRHQLALIGQEFKQIKLENSASGKLLDADRLNTNIQSAQLRIQNLRQTYSAFVNDPNLSAKWQALFDESQVISSQKELTNLNAKIRLFEQELINAGKHTQSFWDNFKANAVKMGTWMILGGVISGVMRGVTGLYDAVVELDTAMVELKKVTNETDEAYDNFLSSAAEKAVQIGTTYADFVSSTADFARLGYELEDAQGLAEVANIYAVVGDEIDGVDTATSSIISTMKAFNIEAKDAMLIVDKFNEVGNNFAISSGGIGDAMSRSASALASANNTIDESIALIVAANNVIQDPDIVGNMWKTVSMRIRGAKTELEEAGLETEYMAESTASLRKQIKALTNIDGLGGFDIMLDDETFKSTYDIILGISKVWKDMSDIDQAALLELLAGKRQGNALASAINNMDDAVDVLKTSVEAEGSAMAEHEKWMDSIQAKQQQFQAQYQALANTILNSDLVKFAYDAGTGLLGWLTELVDTLGALPTLAAAITPFFDKLQLLQKSGNKNWLGSGTGISFPWQIRKENLAADVSLLEEYNGKIAKLGNLTGKNQEMQIIWNDTIGRGSQNLKTMVKVSDGAAISTDVYKNAMTGAAASTKGLGVASKVAAVGVGILRTALNMLVNIGITFVITSLISALQSAAAEAEELREKTIAESEALTETVNSFKDAYVAAAQYGDRQTLTASEERDFQYAVEQAAAALGDKKLAIDDATASTQDYIEALKDASKEELRQAALKANDAADAARDALQETVYSDWTGELVGFEMVDSSIEKKSEEYQKAWRIVLDDMAEYAQLVGITADKQTMFGKIEGVKEWHIEPQDFKSMDDIVAYYYDLVAVKDRLNEAGLRETTIYDSISKDVSKLGDVVDKYVKTEYDRLSLNYMYQNGIPDSMESFTDYRDYMQESMGNLFDVDAMPSIVDAYLAGETDQYAKYIGELTGLTAKRQEILDKITSTDIWQAHNGENSSYHEQSLMQKMETLSAEKLDIVYKAVMEDGITTWNEMLAAISAYNSEQENTQTGAETLQTIFGDFWNSEDFADTREELQALAQTVTGITPENVEELAAESDELASMLALDGMNAKFLANILQTMARGGNGLALITSEALAINKALDGMTGAFDSVTAAKIRYDAAMSVEEKDTNFRSYAEAFAELNAQFEAGTTNSNAFWAAAEFLFGSEQLTAWGWSDGLEEIRQAMNDNKSVFENADSAGAGFIERLYEMSEAGQLVNEKGEKLLEIQKTADGGYAFDVEPENIAAIATVMGITEEAALACFEALSMWGDVSFYDIEEVVATLEDIGFAAETSGGKAVNVSLLTEQMLALGKTDKEIYDVLTALEACDGITLFGVTDDVNKLKSELIDLGLAADDGVTVSVNYEGLTNLMSQLGFTKEEAQETINLLGAADGITLTNASGEVKSVDDALAHIDTLTFTNVTTSVGSISDAVADVDESSTDQVCGELASVGGAAEEATTKVYNLQTALDSLQSKEITVTYNVERKGGLLGVLGFAKGTKNAPAGEALVGEEGAELWQSGDQARLVGVNGPEIVDLNEGDRIYTNAQTKKILGSSGKRLSGTIPAYRAGLNNQFVMVQILDGGGGDSVSPPDGGISGVINPNPSGDETSTDNRDDVVEEVGNDFEDLYKKHQHLRAMDQESQADYLAWLNDAYKEAYENGEIELEDYYKYQEEVYQGLQDLFRDYLGDNEHLIDMLGHYDNTDGQIVGIYQSMMAEIEKEIAAARAAGMDDNDDYIQELQSKWMEYFDAVADIQEETTDATKEAVEELVKYRIDMIKQELENERDALDEKLDYLREFYDKQKEMLRDQYDHENYLRDQQEKRRSVTDIQAELEELRFDDSAWAQRRKLELEEELAEAQDDLRQFEDEHALDMALDALDNAYNSQEEQIRAEMDALEDKLNDPNALYNLALEDIKNNSKDQLYYQMLMYNRQYGDGNDETVNELWESAYGALDDYARLFGELYEGIELSNETGVEEGGSWDESPILGTNPDNQPSEPTNGGTADILPGGTEPELKKGSQITVKDTATHFSAKSGGVRMASFVPGGKYTVYRTSGDEVLIGRNDVYTGWIKKSDIVGYASGTKHTSAGLHRFDERGSEYIFSDQGGGKYRLFSSNEKVLDTKASSWLYDFAATRGLGVVDKLIASFASAGDEMVDSIVGALHGSVSSIARMMHGATDARVINNNIDMSGDINIQGNADKKTVSEIRREKHYSMRELLKEMNKLKG